MRDSPVSEFLSCLMTAASSCSLYGPSHPMVREFSARACGLLPEAGAGDTLSLLMIGDSLIVNDVPCADKRPHMSSFMKRLKKKRVDRVVFRSAVDADEMERFVEALGTRSELATSANISVGIIEVPVSSGGIEAAGLVDEGAEKVREALDGVSRFKRLDMVGLEDAVVSFIGALKRESKVLRIVSPVKSYNQYTFVHATNVSVLTLFQAESLGVKGEELHDIGLAGLLHDMGKLFVSGDVLDKPGKLDDAEWREMQRHPVAGAIYLSRLEDVPQLASVVAFEHHMKFDGSGYPETRAIGRKQHIVSQMVAIADVFDALRTERPYRRPTPVGKIATLLQEGAGRREFNPVLVDSFLRSLSQITSIV